jgi:hypothetical protein
VCASVGEYAAIPAYPAAFPKSDEVLSNSKISRALLGVSAHLNEFVADRMEKLIRSRGSATLGSRLFTDDM